MVEQATDVRTVNGCQNNQWSSVVEVLSVVCGWWNNQPSIRVGTADNQRSVSEQSTIVVVSVEQPTVVGVEKSLVVPVGIVARDAAVGVVTVMIRRSLVFGG